MSPDSYNSVRDTPEGDNQSIPDLGDTLTDLATEEPPKDALEIGRVSVKLTYGNPLIVAGADLIRLADRLCQPDRVLPRIGVVREMARDGLQTLRETLSLQGHDPLLLERAVFILTALLDDVVLNSPLRDKEDWRENLLVQPEMSIEETSDGFFSLVESCQSPDTDYRLAELAYLALALGFNGELRIDPGGPLKLTQMRERLLRRLRENPSADPQSASIFQGGTVAHRGLSLLNPFSMVIAGVAAVVIALSVALWISGYEPPQDVIVAPGELATRTVLPPEPDRLGGRVEDILKQDIDAGVISVSDRDNALVLRIQVEAVFKKGSAALKKAHSGTIPRIGAAIAQGEGPVYLVSLESETMSVDEQAVAAQRVVLLEESLKMWAADSTRLTHWRATLPAVADPETGALGATSDQFLVILTKNVLTGSGHGDTFVQPAWY